MCMNYDKEPKMNNDQVGGVASQNESESSLTPQQQENRDKIQQAIDKYSKSIAVTDLPESLKAPYVHVIQLLGAFKGEISAVKTGALDRKEQVKSKIDALCATGKISYKDFDFSRTEESVGKFIQLLDKMLSEVAQDEQYHASLVASTRPATITILSVQEESFETFVTREIARLRRYVKNARRDLAISYSRFCFGFDEQIKQLAYIESILRNK